MSTPRLSASSYLVLGWVSLLGKPTTYDISRQVAYSVGEFWPFPQSQLYAETARLAEAGLLASEREEGGRHRRHYSITDEGRRALSSWLAEPTAEAPEIRHAGLLKLFFSELVSTEQVVELARAQEAWHRRQLARYQAVVDKWGDRPDLARRVATARFGVTYARASADFWRDIADNPPE
jgi:PadR family transcriptional regulator, regulatory protein AphA